VPEPAHEALMRQLCVLQAILVVTAVLWVLLCRIAGRALFIEETSEHEHPAEEKHKRLLGDPSGHSDKPTRSENLVRRGPDSNLRFAGAGTSICNLMAHGLAAVAKPARLCGVLCDSSWSVLSSRAMAAASNDTLLCCADGHLVDLRDPGPGSEHHGRHLHVPRHQAPVQVRVCAPDTLLVHVALVLWVSSMLFSQCGYSALLWVICMRVLR